MITNHDGKSMKKADIVQYLTEKDVEKIKLAVEHIQTNGELQRVDNFENYCEFILTKIKEELEIQEETSELTQRARTQYRGIYEGYIKKVRVIVENHGIPKKGHLDDRATQIIHLLESDKYKHLLKVYPSVKESYEIINNPKQKEWHTKDYEKSLNHLNDTLAHAQAERALESRMKVRRDLVNRITSN